MAYRNDSAGDYVNIKNDRFGNAYQVKKAWWNESGFAKAHVILGGKLYAIEFGSASKDDDKTGKAFTWVRVTAKKKQDRARSM